MADDVQQTLDDAVHLGFINPPQFFTQPLG